VAEDKSRSSPVNVEVVPLDGAADHPRYGHPHRFSGVDGFAGAAVAFTLCHARFPFDSWWSGVDLSSHSVGTIPPSQRMAVPVM